MERQIAEFLDEIVANVKKERQKRGVSQLALVGILGHKSPNYIAKIETRKHGRELQPAPSFHHRKRVWYGYKGLAA